MLSSAKNRNGYIDVIKFIFAISIADFHFNTGVFTNLSPDHIGENEHKDFDEYLECKKMIFKH